MELVPAYSRVSYRPYESSEVVWGGLFPLKISKNVTLTEDEIPLLIDITPTGVVLVEINFTSSSGRKISIQMKIVISPVTLDETIFWRVNPDEPNTHCSYNRIIAEIYDKYVIPAFSQYMIRQEVWNRGIQYISTLRLN